MALIIENGSVVADADSFITLVDARTYATNYGLTLPVDDVEAEVVLRKGYQNLLTQEYQLQGSRISAVQTGIYPRGGVLNNCFAVASDIIPNEVIQAQMMASDAINSGANTNNVDNGQDLAGFNVQGVYSETYQSGSSTKTNDTIQGVYNALYPLTKAGFAASPCGSGSGGLYRQNMGYLG